MISRYQNGQQASEVTLRDGELNGKSTTWYENGQKGIEIEYRDGAEVSRVEWDRNGSQLKPA
jgi:antitoxin component YwqK of YwqJK toxin-antitoxin module